MSKKESFSKEAGLRGSSPRNVFVHRLRASQKALAVCAPGRTSPSFLGIQTTDRLYLFSSVVLDLELAIFFFKSVMNFQLAIGSSVRKCKGN